MVTRRVFSMWDVGSRLPDATGIWPLMRQKNMPTHRKETLKKFWQTSGTRKEKKLTNGKKAA
jgi:hypothetical protein